MKLFKSRMGGPVIAVTCDEQTPLAKLADYALLASDAQEKSVAQTRSFSSMAVLAQALSGVVAGQSIEPLFSLPILGEHLLTHYHPLAKALGQSRDLNRFCFLGSGFLYGVACEAMLKMKEMSLSSSEAFHFLEFRHGPMSMVSDQTLVVGLLSKSAQNHEVAVLREMHERGAHILMLSEKGSGWESSERVHEIIFNSDLPRWASPVLYLPVLHLLAYYRALLNAQNPDRPAQLEAVVSLDSLLGD